MIVKRRGPASPLGIWLPRLVSAFAFLTALGFLWHTSLDPVVFDKYDVPYAIFLLLLFFVFLPAFHWLITFCAVRHDLVLRSGLTLVLRPWQKTAAVLFAAWTFSQAADALTHRFVNRQLTTFTHDMYHPYLQNTPVPGDAKLHINRWGFRGEDLEKEKPDDVFRIFVFGGSTVYCGTVPFEKTHCRLLEKRLGKAYPQYRIEVQNLGADWHCTEHDTIKVLFFAQDFSPDLLISFHAINDLVRSFTSDLFTETHYWSDYRHYYGAAAVLATQGRKLPLFSAGFAGYWYSDWRFDRLRVNGPEGDGVNGMRGYFVLKAYPVHVTQWKSLPAFRRNVRDFVAIARAKGMQVLLATQPSLYREDLTTEEQQLLAFPLTHHFRGERASLKSMIEGMQQFNDATRRLAVEDKVELVDLEQRMPKSTQYIYDDVHYTVAGNQLIADAFAEKIIESGVIDRVMEQRRKATDTLPAVKPLP
jgi:hypothetical protein